MLYDICQHIVNATLLYFGNIHKKWVQAPGILHN